MANPPSLLDPFGVWGALGARAESTLKQLADRGVASDGFAFGMNKALNASLWADRRLRKLQHRLLAALELPSRSELLAVGEKLQSVEDRLLALSEQLEQLEAVAAPMRAAALLPAPPRTRKPPPVAEATAPPRRRKARR
jgi:hypothetical protein